MHFLDHLLLLSAGPLCVTQMVFLSECKKGFSEWYFPFLVSNISLESSIKASIDLTLYNAFQAYFQINILPT